MPPNEEFVSKKSWKVGKMASKLMAAFLALAIFAMPLASASSWTVWMDRDDPGTTGDWETLNDFYGLYPGQCANPIGVECKTLAGIDHSQTGQVVSCTPTGGFYCVNADNNQTCFDYKVRFLCGDSANLPPVINGVGGPTSLQAGEAGTWSISAYDPDGTYLYYGVDWGDNSDHSASASTATFQHTYSQAGTYTITFTVKDGENATTTATTTVQVPAGEVLALDLKVNGADNPIAVPYNSTVAVSWNSNGETCTPYGHHVLLPDGGTWTGLGQLAPSGSMTLLAAHTLGYFTNLQIGIHCSLGAQTATDTVDLPVTMPSQNQPPVITSTSGPTSIAVNQQGTWGISAYDPDGNYLMYNVVWGDEAARGMQPETAYSSSATFQHTYIQPGEYTIIFSVKDNSSAATQSTRTVGVTGGTAQQCTDSDGGVVFRIRGETKPCAESANCEISVDSCASDGRTLREYYCSDSSTTPVQSYAYVCPDGCSNGACISSLQNQAPVITATAYPAELMVGELGRFSMSAYDPEGGRIYFTADWGDGVTEKQDFDSAFAVASQGAAIVFEHRYSRPGTFKPVFTVADSSGKGAESQARVLVRNTQSANYFDADVSASPSEMAVGDTFKVSGKISYQPASEPAIEERKLMVVAKYLENENRYMANKKGASLKSQEEASSATSVASIATERVPSDYQVRTDYITLSPGEASTVTAFFTAKSLGTHKVTIDVYDITVNDKSMSATGMASRKELVASASTSVKVSREQPPNPPQGQMTINLQRGWNMVSVPSDAVVTVSDIAGTCDISPFAWYYNPAGNSYQQATALKAGYGYWIKANSDCQYKMVSPFVKAISQRLSPGWNMVGAPGSAVSTSDFLGDCQVTSGPWYYSPSAGQYSYSATIKPGNAYWFKVSSACTIGNGALTPPAPPS